MWILFEGCFPYKSIVLSGKLGSFLVGSVVKWVVYAEVYILQLFRLGGGWKKTCTFGVFWEENLYLRKISLLLGENSAKIEHFLNFSKNYSLKMQ